MKFWGPEAVGLSALGVTGVAVMTMGIYTLPHPVHISNELPEQAGAVADFFAHQHTPHFLGCIILSSLFNGFFVVPLQAMAQRRADPKIRAQLMSAGAVILNLFTNATTFILIWLALKEMPPKMPFLFVAAFSALVAIYAIYRSFHPVNRHSYMKD